MKVELSKSGGSRQQIGVPPLYHLNDDKPQYWLKASNMFQRNTDENPLG
jgi:hypothetical protein